MVVDRKEYKFNLLVLYRIIRKNIKFIIAAAFIAAILTLAVVPLIPKTYESSVIINPIPLPADKAAASKTKVSKLAGLTGEDVNTNLESYNLIYALLNEKSYLTSFIIKNKMEKHIIINYDKISHIPDYYFNKRYYISSSLRSQFKVDADKTSGLITISYQNPDRRFIKTFLGSLVEDIDTQIRRLDMTKSYLTKKRLNNEIKKISDPVVKRNLENSLYALTKAQITNQASHPYALTVMKQAWAPDKSDFIAPQKIYLSADAIIMTILIVTGLILVINARIKQNI